MSRSWILPVLCITPLAASQDLEGGVTDEQLAEAVERLGELSTLTFTSLGIQNGMSKYEILDILITLLEKEPVEDLDGDGEFSLQEFAAHAKGFLLRLTGDVTGDGVVDQDDMIVVSQQLGQVSPDLLPKGDTDGDGDVDADDMVAVISMSGVELPLSDAVAAELVSRLIYKAIEWGILPRDGDDDPIWDQLNAPGPNDHAEYFSSGWPNDHSSANSNFWPPNHSGSISPTWVRPPNHNQLQSEIWPANHFVQPSESWPPLPSDEHYQEDSRFWPSNHQGYVTPTWPDAHLNDASRTWPPNHTVPASIGTGPPSHDTNISEGWEDWDHDENASLQIWPENHAASISASWPIGHAQESSDRFPPNHFGAISTQWPGGDNTWPGNHLTAYSIIWDDDPTGPTWFPEGHTRVPSAELVIPFIGAGVQ